MLQIVTGIIFNHLIHGIDYGAICQHSLKTKHQSSGHSIANHFSTTGIGCYIAANLAAAPGAEVQWHKQPVFCSGVLEHLQRCSSPGAESHGRSINIFNPIHALEGDSKLRSLRGRAPSQTRQPSLHYHWLIVLMAQRHNLR